MSKAMFTACTNPYLPMQPKMHRACAHPPGPPSGEPADQQTRCTCCGGQQLKAGSRPVEDGGVHTLAVPVWDCGACGACRWCYLIVKMTPPPHHNRRRLCFCRSSTGTAELQPLRGAIQAIHRDHSLGNRSGKSPFTEIIQFLLPAP